MILKTADGVEWDWRVRSRKDILCHLAPDGAPGESNRRRSLCGGVKPQPYEGGWITLETPFHCGTCERNRLSWRCRTEKWLKARHELEAMPRPTANHRRRRRDERI